MRRFGIVLGIGLSGTAWAKPCELDLQIVLLNPLDAAEAPLDVADRLTWGLFTRAFGGPIATAITTYAATTIEEELHASGVEGTVRRLPAVQSGRDSGWIAWDPETGTTAESSFRAEDLADHDMLVVHVEHPEEAAVTVGGKRRATIDLAKALGVDVRARVYEAIFARMQPSLAARKLRVLVNTGRGLKCRKVRQDG